MSSANFYKWHAEYGDMGISMISKLQELEVENALLKKVCADE